MTDVEQRAAAKHFAEYWAGKGYEKGQCQPFWLSLLGDVLGVEYPGEYISFEDQVHLDHTSFIDGFIPATKVLIEQKSLGKSLTAAIPQSDGSLLSPLQQAQRYVHALLDERGRGAVPRWVVTCNFEEFRIYDLDHPQAGAQVIKLSDLPDECYRLKFLVKSDDDNLKREMELSLKAGELVGKIHDRFLEKYHDPMAKHTQRSLNILCVRLVFCLYAEDAGLFGPRDAFSRYIGQYEPKDIRRALIDLFKTLDTPYEERPDLYLSDELAAFPYVNGGLFQDENIVIPQLTEELKTILLESAHFDWSKISPTIFGAVFESTLNPETRRSNGMHYTSIENIHKLIDPLFLDDLNAELRDIKAVAVQSEKTRKLKSFQKKLASLTFLDPACGSGNFLTETYVCLRRLENEVLTELHRGQVMFASEETSPIQVSISQFFGIEINDFAVTVAKTALWIAESQMMKETEDVVLMPLDFLPLKTNANIVESNALRIDWNKIVSNRQLSFIMGNPPFRGSKERDASQNLDMETTFVGEKKWGKCDYCVSWYKKAADYAYGTGIHCALVSTNSICQGEQVQATWERLFNKGIKINFAYRTFQWDSEASIKAHVHCIIVGFSYQDTDIKRIYDASSVIFAGNINGYLIDAPNVFIPARGRAIDNKHKSIVQGCKPVDSGGLVLYADDRREFIENYPELSDLIRPYVGSDEFINSKERYCLWLRDVPPSRYRQNEFIRRRLQIVSEKRASSPTPTFRKYADRPYIFVEDRQPDENYLLIPGVSSQRRKYIPIGYMPKEVVVSDKAYVIPSATLYDFGLLTSNVHNAWMRVVCGRLKSDYSYTPIAYNTMAYPEATEAQIEAIEQTAQAILNARALYPDCSLADLYDELTMPPELRTAHQNNDRAVMAAYGMSVRETTESSCVAELMRRYQELVSRQ